MSVRTLSGASIALPLLLALLTGCQETDESSVHTPSEVAPETVSPLPNASFEELCAMLATAEKENAASELRQRGLAAVKPLLQFRLDPNKMMSTDGELIAAHILAEDIIVGNGEAAFPILEEFVNSIEEPDPLDRLPTSQGYTVPTAIYAIETITELGDRIHAER